MKKFKTKRQAVRAFEKYIVPLIEIHHEADGKRNIFIRREEWANWTKTLLVNGSITEKQYNTWLWPKSCKEEEKANG